MSATHLVLVHDYGIRVSSSSGRLTISANQFSNSEIGGKLKRLAESDEPMRRECRKWCRSRRHSRYSPFGNQFSGLKTPAVQTNGDCHRILLQGNLATECAQGMAADQPWFDLRKAVDSEASGKHTTGGVEALAVRENVEALVSQLCLETRCFVAAPRLIFVAMHFSRRSLPSVGFPGRAWEPVGGDERGVSEIIGFSFACDHRFKPRRRGR